MNPDPEEREHRGLRAVLVYVALVACAGANFLIGRVSDLGDWRLYGVLLFAVVEMAIGSWYWMHLDEQRGARRAALPVSLFFVTLLGLLTITDLITRWGPVRPDGPSMPMMPPAISARVGAGLPPRPIPDQVTGGPN